MNFREIEKCKFGRAVGKVYGTLTDAVFPRRCPMCDEIVGERKEKICLSCMKKMKLLTPPWCMKCGKKVKDGETLCKDCEGTSHVFCRGRALYEYEDAAISIYRFKYNGRKEYADYFGEQMAEYLGGFIRSVKPDALVPIPLYWRKKVSRGYNQAEVLACRLGELLEIPVRTDVVRRIRSTVPQKKLNPQERQNNLKKAFKIVRNDVKLETIILVDDIYTTGATIDAVAQVFRSAGVDRIYYVSLTCGVGV